MLLQLGLPLKAWLLSTWYTNYVIKALIRALQNFTTLVTCQQMSRNWCCSAARYCFGYFDFKAKWEGQHFKPHGQNQWLSFVFKVDFDILVEMVRTASTAYDREVFDLASKMKVKLPPWKSPWYFILIFLPAEICGAGCPNRKPKHWRSSSVSWEKFYCTNFISTN